MEVDSADLCDTDGKRGGSGEVHAEEGEINRNLLASDREHHRSARAHLVQLCGEDPDVGRFRVADEDDVRCRARTKSEDARIISGEQCEPICWELLNELPLRRLNCIKITRPLRVHRINGGDNSDARTCERAERPNLSAHVHSHLRHKSLRSVWHVQ